MELELNEVIEDLEYLISDSCTDTQFDYIEEIEIATKSLKKQIQRNLYLTITLAILFLYSIVNVET